MIENSRIPFNLDKRFGFQNLQLVIFLTAVILPVNVVGAQVYQCATRDGGVIFTDTPAHLEPCQELLFEWVEEELRRKETGPSSDSPVALSRMPQAIAMVDDEFFEPPSQDLEDQESFEPGSFDREDEKFFEPLLYDFAEDDYSDAGHL